MGDLFDLYDPGHEFHDYDDPDGEWRRRVERDEEKEPGPPLFALLRPPQFRCLRGRHNRNDAPLTEATNEIRRAS